jgi:membrane protein
MPRAAPSWKVVAHFFQREIWRAEHLTDRSPRGWLYATLRVATITVTGLTENKAASRAAALSFSSLLGLGPLIVIAVLVAGFVVKGDTARVETALNDLLHRAVPSLGQMASDSLAQLIDGFIKSSRSGTAGMIGGFTLIIIVLQLFSSVENAFNEIWGVRRGRSLPMRIILYWAVLTLGALVFFAAVTGLSPDALFGWLGTQLHFSPVLLDFLRLLLPSATVLVLVALLTLFYRFAPNTKVRWIAAFLGAAVVSALLVLNNLLAFLYVQRVAMQTTLYGSLSLLPVLMAGLYIFWLFVLLGGQISYAVQNVHFRNSQALWGALAESVRERLSLLVLLTIGRRFAACLPPCAAPELGEVTKVPTQIINECLNRLVLMGLVTPVPPPPGEPSTDYRYQPARPLNRVTLGEFKRLDDDHGDAAVTSPLLVTLDPLVAAYEDALAKATGSGLFTKTLEELFAEHPMDASRPPFAFGKRVKPEE